jgi:MFS family permease
MYLDILRDVKIMLVVLSLFLGNGLIAMMEVTFPLFLDQIFKFPSWAVGLTYGGNTFAYTITMAIIGRFQFKRSRGLILGVTLMGLSAIVILFIKHPAWVIPVWVAMGNKKKKMFLEFS